MLDEDEERLASSCDSSSSNGSVADAEEVDNLAEVLKYEEIPLVTGFSLSSDIHCISELDDGAATKVITNCGARPNRARAEFGRAVEMKSKNKSFSHHLLQ